jgi:DEAD/DEAH box helicase domain-containing protein
MVRRNVEDVLKDLRQDPRFLSCITAWHHFPAAFGDYLDIPEELHPLLKLALREKAITALYSHQREAYDRALQGEDICIVTPTASGKTMCYNLPVLDAILKDNRARALYMFPTKALAQDQLAEVEDMCKMGKLSIKTFTFDGDTPTQKRRLAKETGQIIITNPDMLHQAILPHHPTWVRLFTSLKYVIIDEMHNYRGVFGSHVANVIRRLKRICLFYGTSPQFILASATIANPGELALALTGKPVALIDKNGAPAAEKDFIFYNPPAGKANGSLRQSSIDAASRIGSRFIKNDIQTLIFARSRKSCELLVQYLRDSYNKELGKSKIQGYRGGYLPNERRAIEKGLRKGDIIGVAATNALELGIDVGRLDVVLMAGYPGTIASTWQQAGRAGRRQGKSAAVLVAGGSPLDQFIIKNPGYFFEQSPEYALINPDNPYILGQHVKCASYELPFTVNPDSPPELGTVQIEHILEHLAEQKILHKGLSRWNWSSDSFPAAGISLRSASNDNFVVIDITQKARVIGEVDWASAPMLVHEQAIYMHKGRQYHVIKMDYPSRKAYVKQVDIDYYTDANLAVGVKVITVDEVSGNLPITPKLGELSVTALATVYKKIKLYTNENLGSGEIILPEMNLHTQGMWFSIPNEISGKIDPHFIGGILSGLANVLLNIAPLFLMSDKRDLGVAVEVRSAYDGRPTVYLYDSYPGGVGLAEKAFHVIPYILKACLELISSCPCRKGCPGCTGPEQEVGEGIKALSIQVLDAICDEVQV